MCDFNLCGRQQRDLIGSWKDGNPSYPEAEYLVKPLLVVTYTTYVNLIYLQLGEQVLAAWIEYWL